MKHLVYILLIAVSCLSCQSNNKDQQNTDSTKASSVPAAVATTDSKTQKLINEFKPIIQGVWLRKDYLDKVAETKSPYTARELAEGITGLEIGSDAFIGDSLNITVSYNNNHEGGNIAGKIIKGTSAKTIILKDAKENSLLKYSIDKKDTVLNLTYKYFDRTENATFVKVRPTQSDDQQNTPLNLSINKLIMAGNYNWIDNMVLREVTFTNDGKVVGLPEVENYWINSDFVVGIMNNLDQLIFEVNTPSQKDYTFKISKDTLKIYNILANADSSKMIVGDLKYQLIRKK